MDEKRSRRSNSTTGGRSKWLQAGVCVRSLLDPSAGPPTILELGLILHVSSRALLPSSPPWACLSCILGWTYALQQAFSCRVCVTEVMTCHALSRTDVPVPVSLRVGAAYISKLFLPESQTLQAMQATSMAPFPYCVASRLLALLGLEVPARAARPLERFPSSCIVAHARRGLPRSRRTGIRREGGQRPAPVRASCATLARRLQR
mmetsp:Transcript_4644/g.12921  ORF Transcript_4644/g.12921 Transcript_4644/m.12921 type:complete len:205 (+) Transcript_4644:478-1092(+)